MLENLFIFITGLLFGSFYNVCIYRIPNKESISFPPSHCSNCKNQLKILDLIPILSYVFLKGKCRYCNEKISIQYPVIEFITGLSFLIVFLRFGYTIKTLQGIVLISIIILVIMIDLKHYIIPDRISLITLILGVIFAFIIKEYTFKSLLYSFLAGPLLLFVFAYFGGMGFGDFKIMVGFSFFLGFERMILAMLISFVLGGIIGILLLALKIKSRKDQMPFGPYLGLGTIISFLYFKPIVMFYFENFV